MKTRELQRMAKELNKVVAPSPPINLNADRDTLNNEVEEVTGMLAKGDKIPQWLMDKIKDAEFNLPKGVGVEGKTKVHTKKDIDNKIVSDKKEKAEKKISKEITKYNHGVNCQGGQIDIYLDKGYGPEDIAKKVKITVARVKHHMNHLKKEHDVDVSKFPFFKK